MEMCTRNRSFLFPRCYIDFLDENERVKPRWVKRKRQLSRVESMLAAKSQRAASGESSSSTSVQQPDQLFEEQSSAVSVGEQSTLEESFLLPRVYSSDEETDSDTESDFNETSAKEIYRDWMSSQCKSDVQMMPVVLMDTFRERFGMTDVFLKQKLFRKI